LNAGYKFIKSGKDYEFFTAYGTAYAVSFNPASSYFDTSHPVRNFIHRIDIAQMDTGPYNRQDLLTGITVAEIVNDFFEADNRNVLFYICDPKDGRMKARQRKFDYWFRLFSSNAARIIADISTKAIAVEVVFIFDKNNPFAYDLPLIIDEAKNSFDNK
jgi:hypothetical protein